MKRPLADVAPCHLETKVSVPTHNQQKTHLRFLFIINPERRLLTPEAPSKFQTRLPF